MPNPFASLRSTALVALSVAGLMAASSAIAQDCPDGMDPVSEFQLFFGIADDSGNVVPEEEWELFLADTISPRFPDGLTIYDGRGQWLDSAGKLHHDEVKVVMAATYGELSLTPAREISAEFKARHGGTAFVMWNAACAGIFDE